MSQFTGEHRRLRHGHDLAGRDRCRPSCAAVRDAGFSQIMLSARDIVGHEDGVDAAVQVVRDSGLRVTGFQVLRDFEGLSGHLHDYKIDIAKSMLEMCARAWAPRVLLVCSSTSTHATTDRDALARDLRKLAMLAVPLRHQGRLRGPVVGPHHQRVSRRLGRRVPRRRAQPRHRHRLVPRVRDQDLARRPRRCSTRTKIFLVQLADFMWTGDPHRSRSASPPRGTSASFPAKACTARTLAELVTRLDAPRLPRRLQLRGLQRRLPADAAGHRGAARVPLGALAG